jgi:sortase (surface protein transpeptidase)
MRNSFSVFIIVLIATVGISMPLSASASQVTGELSAATVATPVRLVIPSIGLNARIKGVGANAKGAMVVPSGASKSVGWYKNGVVPGQTGSAVIDAHVFAAFSKLKYLKSGADVYVTMTDGATLHFVVSDAQTYALAALSSKQQLFRPTQSADLNLITCAGSLTKDRSTYDHRLVVYTTLVS